VQMHVTLIMVATIYHLLAALNVHWLANLSLPVSALIVAGVVWLHVFLKTLGEVAILSYVNFTINCTLLAVVIIETLSHPPTITINGTTTNVDEDQQLIVNDIMSVGGAFASFGFAYGCHPILPDVRGSMLRPEQYSPMIVFCFGVALALYVPFVTIAYATYGVGIESPIYETSYITCLPVMRAIKAVTIFPMIFTYPLVLTPPEGALERALDVDSRAAPRLWRIGLRSLFVVFTTGATILVRSKENFGPLVDLVSSCTSTFTVYLLPCAFHLKLRGIGGPHGIGKLELAANVAVIALASIGAIFGTVQALEQLASLGTSNSTDAQAC